MTDIRTPVKGFTGEVAGVMFVDGAASTDNPGAIAYFRRHGYTVGAAVDEPRPVDQMTVPELKAHATEAGIDLDGAKTKAEILAIVTAHAVTDEDDESTENN